MSHFSVMVVGADYESQLAPFDERIEMPRYVGYTKQQLIEKERKWIEDYKNGTYAYYLKDKDAYKSACNNEAHLNYLESEFPKMLDMDDEQLYEKAVLSYDEDMIGRDGEVYSTYNPQAEWDWWMVGGRWAGALKLKKGVTTLAPPNFSFGWSSSEIAEVRSDGRVDTAFKHQIDNLDEIVCFAILINGDWYDRDNMGRFAVVTDEDTEWGSVFKQILAGVPDDELLTIIDCHI